MMVEPISVGQKVAQMLLDIEAVHISDGKPFIFTSGKASPVYIDCRKIISFPEIRRFLMTQGAKMMAELSADAPYDAVAGGETAGIPFAAWMSEELDKPMQYIRKKPKGFGRDAQIEGLISEGQHILLVEDLATDGGSKLNFINAIRTAGAQVNHIFVIFYYDIFKDAMTKLADEQVSLHYLATWWDVLAAIKADPAFSDERVAKVESFLHDPVTWSRENGGE
ncbi:MAG: orotate phosphoribosyltransferase [Candidatus Puniceispirillaceae bacterium]